MKDMGIIKSFKDLRSWQEAHALTLEIYRLTRSFPPEERYGLTAQIRSAALSVPSNIAEGMGRGSTKDFMRFLTIARGSVQEVLAQLELSKDLEYMSQDTFASVSSRYEGLSSGIATHIRRLSLSSEPLHH